MLEYLGGEKREKKGELSVLHDPVVVLEGVEIVQRKEAGLLEKRGISSSRTTVLKTWGKGLSDLGREVAWEGCRDRLDQIEKTKNLMEEKK